MSFSTQPIQQWLSTKVINNAVQALYEADVYFRSTNFSGQKVVGKHIMHTIT